MELESESESGSKIPIEPGSDTQIGRELGLGFGPSATDHTVSRRHLSLRLIDDPADKFRVGFVVIGKNPIWVCFSNGGDRRIYKNSEKGALRIGDKLSLSIKKPSFWVVKRRGGENEEDEERKRALVAVARREKRTVERREKKEVFRGEDDDDDGEEIGAVDVSQIDPVKEFGFLVKGHEFDQYPKKRIIAAKNWSWFLEEPNENSDDDETIDGATSSKRKKGRTRKKKKGGADDDDDEEWTGESEDEKEVGVKGGSTKRPKYTTRSKDPKRPRNGASGARIPALRKDVEVCDSEVEEEDEEDGTLGGFIVDEEQEEVVEDEESEDEFDDEDEEE